MKHQKHKPIWLGFKKKKKKYLHILQRPSLHLVYDIRGAGLTLEFQINCVEGETSALKMPLALPWDWQVH